MNVRSALLLLPLLLPSPYTAAAESAREATMIPQIVYVGDRARLVVRLDAVLSDTVAGPVALESTDLLPRSAAADIIRFEIERRPDGDRALIDFIPFEPGRIALPAVEAGGARLDGLFVEVRSSLEPGMSSLSPPEAPLAAPGTFALIYGLLSAALGFAAFAFFLFSRLLPRWAGYRERRRRGLAARSLRRTLAELAAGVERMSAASFLNVLFAELRSYLSFRTGANCHALTAGEYGSALAAGNASAPLDAEDLRFLESLFRRGDAVRFGASPAPGSELRALLDRVAELVDRVEALPC